MPHLIQKIRQREEASGNSSPYGPKIKSHVLREQVLAEIAKFDRRGYTQRQIGEVLKETFNLELAQTTISSYLKTIRTSYHKARMAEHADLVAEKLEQYREIRAEAWMAYERSKENRDKTVSEYVMLPEDTGIREAPVAGGLVGKLKALAERRLMKEMQKVKEIITREGRLPATSYLDLIMKTLEAERELLGLDEAKKIDVTQVSLPWDQILQAAGVDPVEERIKNPALGPQSSMEPIVVGPTIPEEPEEVMLTEEPQDGSGLRAGEGFGEEAITSESVPTGYGRDDGGGEQTSET